MEMAKFFCHRKTPEKAPIRFNPASSSSSPLFLFPPSVAHARPPVRVRRPRPRHLLSFICCFEHFPPRLLNLSGFENRAKLLSGAGFGPRLEGSLELLGIGLDGSHLRSFELNFNEDWRPNQA